MAIWNERRLPREIDGEMNKDRQREFIEDAVIRMRDLRDQEDCFSKEEFKGLMSERFSHIAGVIPRKTRKERKKELFTAAFGCVVILVGWAYFIAQGADWMFPLWISICVGVQPVLVAFGACIDGLTIRSVRRIQCSTRLEAVDELLREKLITEKQDKVLRLLIDEAADTH